MEKFLIRILRICTQAIVGVPSFKITDSDGSNPFYVWGQDRMWLLKEEINKRLG